MDVSDVSKIFSLKIHHLSFFIGAHRPDLDIIITQGHLHRWMKISQKFDEFLWIQTEAKQNHSQS